MSSSDGFCFSVKREQHTVSQRSSSLKQSLGECCVRL